MPVAHLVRTCSPDRRRTAIVQVHGIWQLTILSLQAKDLA